MLRADHAATFVNQRGARLTVTYGSERAIARRALRQSGYTAKEAILAIKQADEYFINTLGWTMDTPVNVVHGAPITAGGTTR